MQKVWGKIVGCLLGFAVGGPLGSIMGIIVGHIHDHQPPATAMDWNTTYAGFTGTSQQVTFTVGVIVLGAKMAKADGRVTRAEIDAFKRVFKTGPTQAKLVGRIFDQARKSVDGFEPYALQLSQTFRYNSTVLEEVLGGLFMIAAADSAGLRPAELQFLRRVADIFGFSKDDFYRIAARAGVSTPSHHPVSSENNESYAILGIKEGATADDIKAAYRDLIRKHHPDKLVAQGLPAEFIAIANEKMKRINVAYDTLCRAKGIK